MKYLVKFIVVTFFVLICTYTQAEQKTVYIDMKYVLNNCKAGKAAQDYLAKTFKDNQKKFASTENRPVSGTFIHLSCRHVNFSHNASFIYL